MGLFGRKSAPPPPPPEPTPEPPSLQDIIFKLRFTSKTMGRQAMRSEKQISVEERKAKDALARNNMAGARIHAESAIRYQNEHLNYLKLQSQLEAVSSKLQAQQVFQQVSEGMVSVTASLDEALSNMDVEKIGLTMEKFIDQTQDIDLRVKYMDTAIGESTASSTPANQVNQLLNRIADENNLDVKHKIAGYGAPMANPTIPAAGVGQADVNGDLEARLAALQGAGPKP